MSVKNKAVWVTCIDDLERKTEQREFARINAELAYAKCIAIIAADEANEESYKNYDENKRIADNTEYFNISIAANIELNKTNEVHEIASAEAAECAIKATSSITSLRLQNTTINHAVVTAKESITEKLLDAYITAISLANTATIAARIARAESDIAKSEVSRLGNDLRRDRKSVV